MYRYEDLDLNCSKDLCIGDYENVIVCRYTSHNVHVIDVNGMKVEEIISKSDGVQHPRCVSFRSLTLYM